MKQRARSYHALEETPPSGTLGSASTASWRQSAIKIRVQRLDRPEVTNLYSLGGGFGSLLSSYSERAPGPISNHNS